MDTSFCREQPVGKITTYSESGGLDAGLLARLLIDDFRFESVTFGPSEIHSHQHFSPILCVRPAGSRIDSYDRVSRVIGSREEHFGFGLFDLAFESFDDRL